ncbi:MAG: hypothetical protein AAB649_05930 [Patescibacteria group bacterium]
MLWAQSILAVQTAMLQLIGSAEIAAAVAVRIAETVRAITMRLAVPVSEIVELARPTLSVWSCY